MHNVVVLKSKLGLTSLDIPELYSVVARGTGKDAFGSRIEQNVSNFPA